MRRRHGPGQLVRRALGPVMLMPHAGRERRVPGVARLHPGETQTSGITANHP